MDADFNSYQSKLNGSTELISQAERSIDLEKKVHKAMDHLLEGVQIIDFKWRYVYANEVVVEQSKFSREELMGSTMMEKYPGIEATELFKTLNLCMNERVVKRFENEFTYPDGSKGWFNLSIQPSDEGLTILSHDITQHKKAEKEREEYFKYLERLLYTTSHNLRQPVVQLLGIINLLKSKSSSEEDNDKLLQHLFECVSAMDRYTREITQDLLDLKIKTDSHTI